MWEALITFFTQPPPALDPTLVPWVTAFIAGNVIVVSIVWALLKFIAKQTPWAGDDKIIQVFSGAFAAMKGAIKPKSKPCDEHEAGEEGLCSKCGQVIE